MPSPTFFKEAHFAAIFAVYEGSAKSDQKKPSHQRIESFSRPNDAGHHPTLGGAPLFHFGLLIGRSSRFQ
jgi:hypothetical protein